MSRRTGRRTAGPDAALAPQGRAQPSASNPGILTLFFLYFLLSFLRKVESGDRSGSATHLIPFTRCYFTLALAGNAPRNVMVLGVPSPAQHPFFSLPAGSPSPGEPRQQADGPTVLGDPDNRTAGDPKLHVPGWTPHSHALSRPAPRNPEFLRHWQLPVVPGDAGTPVADPASDAEGPIYESIRYKPGTLKKTWDTGSVPGDSSSLPTGDELSIPVQEIIAQEEPGSEGNPGPVYAQVCKPPQLPQPRQPTGPPEPQEETPPSLPEKRFDVA